MNNLRIEMVEIYKLKIPLKEPFVISLGASESAESIIVRIHTNLGITGFGECSPYMMINGESVDTCFVVGQYFARFLKQKNPLDIEACSAAMDNLIYGNSSIKSAFDMALHDIASRHAGVPLYKFLGGINNKTLNTDMTVSFGHHDKMAADALRFKQEGFPVIKVKLGESCDTDVERIRCIRKAIGHKIPVRIDANQGWSVKTAIETLNALAEFNIQFCEEPIARWNFMKLRKVRKKTSIPIMADESCSDQHDAERLIDLKACDYFNLKLGKSSGFLKAKQIIKLAEKNNIKMQVGGFTESRLGMTAAAHLALCSDDIVYCDLDTPLMFTEDPVSGGITYHENGVVKVTETTGLGAWIEEEWLNKFEKVRV